jgi:tight adherence protein C
VFGPQDPALRLVAERFAGPLSQELLHFCQEVEIGLPRIEAYKNILARNKCKELDVLVQALIQGAQLGVPIATTFAIQARDMRALRAHRAKELAAKASPKITLVTTFLVTPAVFLFIIGLLVLNLIFNPGAFGISGLF